MSEMIGPDPIWDLRVTIVKVIAVLLNGIKFYF